MRECSILPWRRQQTWGDHRRCRVWQVPCRSTTQARWSSCYCWTTSKEFEVVKGEQQTTVWVLHQEWAKEARLKKKDARLVHGKLLTPHWVNRIYWGEKDKRQDYDLSATAWWTWRQCWHQVIGSLGRSTSESTLSSYSLSSLLFIVVMLALNGCLHTITNVARVYLPIEEGRGEGSLVLRSCKEWMKLLAWLPEREHREDAANGFKGEGACWRKEPSGLPEERGESQELEGKSPTWRVCSADFRWLERSFGDVSGIVL